MGIEPARQAETGKQAAKFTKFAGSNPQESAAMPTPRNWHVLVRSPLENSLSRLELTEECIASWNVRENAALMLHRLRRIIRIAMFARRKSFNPKRKIASDVPKEALDALAKSVRYGGNSEHKRNPGDFNLHPPAAPKRDKTLCDEAGIFSRSIATGLLREGIRTGLTSAVVENAYPKNVWAVSEEGIPLEAQLENPANGTYHGYPMPQEDVLRWLVLEKWKAAHE